MAAKTIQHAAPKRSALTLDQLGAFVQDAMRSGATGTEIVAAAVSFSGKLQKISVSIETSTILKDSTA